MKGKLKKITTIVITAIIFFTMGVALPIVVKGENGDATSAQVLAGKTFTSSLVSVATSGEMKNLSGKTFATNNPGVSTIDVDDGYYTEIQVDASAVYNAGIATGEATKETPTLLWTNPSPNENFAGERTIEIDTTQYQAFMIEYKNTKSGSEIGVVYIDNANYPKTYALYSFVPVSHNSRTIVVRSNGLKFGYNYDHTTNGGQYDESRNIPLRIWGYTNPIFTAE